MTGGIVGRGNAPDIPESHHEIAYDLWVNQGRIAARTAELLRQGDPHGEWDAVPGVTRTSVNRLVHKYKWKDRHVQQAFKAAPEQFVHTRSIFLHGAPEAAQFIHDLRDGRYDELDPKILKLRFDAAVHIVGISGHVPVVRANEVKNDLPQVQNQAQNREIADKSIEELRKMSMEFLTAGNDDAIVEGEFVQIGDGSTE